MSVTSDVKTYTDAAIEQAKQVVDQAQTRLAKSAGDATKYVDLDAVKDLVGGYVAQAKATTGAVAGKAEGLVSDLRHDPRLAKAFDDAEAAATTIVGTVNEKVVAPALTLIGRGTHEAAAAPAPRAPKSGNGTASGSTARTTNGTARKAPAKKATAKKAPAKKATSKKATSEKATSKKATAKAPASSANGTSAGTAE